MSRGAGEDSGRATGVEPGALSALLQEVAAAPEVPEAERATLSPGTVIGRFEIVRELGRGGFGVVYEARDRDLGRPVAVKVVRPGRVAEDDGRVLREAEAIARLTHPNLVTLYDVGRSDGGPYLVFEFLRGKTLEERLDDGPMSVQEAVHVATEVARGLAHAHADGVVHRDLKPSNVFVTNKGQVKVLDFGMAHAFGRRRLSGGTPAYMAPEQWDDAPEDERTDVFALGVMLHRMLSGEYPFPEGEGRWSSEPVTLRKLDVPGAPELSGLLEAMLDRNPTGRPRDGAAVLAALGPVEDRLRTRPVDGKPPEHARRRKATLGDLLAELKRRHVFRVMIGYGVFAFAVLQVTEPIMHGAHLPEWVLTVVLVLLALGFPVAVVLAWIYDLTAKGVRRTPSTTDPATPRFGSSRLLLPIAMSAAVLLIAGAGAAAWYAWKRHDPRAGGSGAAPSADGRVSVAVADFANDTRDPDLDGLSVLLTTSLEQSKTLRIVTRGALVDALHRLGQSGLERIDETLARRAGVEAGVRALLLASVRKFDDVYAVEMRAVDPRRDEYLFTVREQTVGKKGILTVIDRLSDRARAELNEPQRDIQTRQVPVAVAATGNLEASAHYFRAQQIMAESLDSDRALAEYRKALALDGEFAQAHLQIALLMTLGEADGDDAAFDAHLAAVLRQGEKIPDRDRRLAEVLAALRPPGATTRPDKERYQAILRDAVASYPDSKELLAVAGQQAVADDQHALAARLLEQALRIDPGYGPALVWLVTVYEQLGRRSDAVVAARRAVAARPGPVSQAVLAQALAVNGEREAAGVMARQVVASGQAVPYLVSDMVWPVLAYAGDWTDAEVELRRWAGPGVLPARQVSAKSALSFLLAAQGRAREIRVLGEEMRGGLAPELSWWAIAMAEALEGDAAAAARSLRTAGIGSAASQVAFLGDLDGAAALAKNLPPDSVEAQAYRAVDAWKRGNPEGAISILRSAVAQGDEGAGVRFLGEFLCQGRGRAEGADLLARWLTRFPSAVNLGRFAFRPHVTMALARCQEELGRRADAAATVDRLLAEWQRADPGLPLLVDAKAMKARLAAPPR